MDVGVEDGGHLGFLDGRDPALREHYEYRYVFFPAEAVDGGAPRVPGCGAADCQVVPVCARLAFVPPDEEVFEKVAEELESDVFKSLGRAVEELEEVKVLGRIERLEGRDVFMLECRVAFSQYFF